LGEGPAWRPALAGIAAGTLQFVMVIAVGAFFVMTAAPTVWDAADDYFPARQAAPAAVVIRPVSTSAPAEPPLASRRLKPIEPRTPKASGGAAQHPPLSRRPPATGPDRRRT
jgi:hypothetical protein